MNLNSSQIKEIKRFINSRGFSHIEVEMEILDHVASAVEDKLEKDPKKSIDQAIREVHSGFGTMGFSTMEDEFIKNFNGLKRGAAKQIAKDYLFGKNVLKTILLFALFILFGMLLKPVLQDNGISFKIYFYLLGILVTMGSVFWNRSKRKKWSKKSLVISQLTAASILTFTIFGQFFGTASNYLVDEEHYSLALFALFSTAICIYSLIQYGLIEWGYQWTNERYLKYSED